MKYRRLGNSNLEVSALCLGTMMFADQTAEPEAAEIVAAARERGINFIDTADVYSRGGSEAMVGRLIAADRHDWVLATKVGNRMAEGRNAWRWSRKWLMQAADDSLRRLDTGYIDLYYLHRDFEHDNLEEALRGLDDLI
jgi:aryl-alcohol dehydrogenase-like predicted oxidoreductase